jgi:DNA polymerase-3 subunit alpha
MLQRVDIHNHTRYSNLRLRDALATPEQLIDKAIELGLAGISISDHEAVSGHIKANKYAQEIKKTYPNFKVMLGDEIYLVDSRPSDEHYHYVLTAIDEIGYHQIKEISSIAWLHSYASKGMTRVDTLKSDLERIVMKNPGHLIGSTACIGSELGQSILKLTKAEKSENAEMAKFYHNKIVNYILWNKKVFGDNFYIEVQPGVSKEQITVNQRTLSIAQCFKVKMIPTSDTHYLRPEDRYIHKSFLNSENKEREVDAFYQDAYLHTNDEMIEKFALSNFDKLFVEQMFENSMEIYYKVKDFSLFHPQTVPKVAVDFYPKQKAPAALQSYQTLAKMYESDDEIDRYWITTCINKLKEIDKLNTTYLNELEEEAEVKSIIGQKLNTNMFAYPVCLAHYIKMIWDTGSSVGVGRGSACSALNHYLLGITQLDPIEWNFPFFRYMNRDTDGLGSLLLILLRR